MAFAAVAEESTLTFWIYGVDKQITQKYEGLFEVPQFEFMGGAALGDYVYVVTLVTTIVGNDYYCVGIMTDSWFDQAVKDGGFVTLAVIDKQVRLSYRSVILINVPFKER